MKARAWSASLVLLVASAWPVQADRGAIPFQPEVTIFEPTQRALIAWNGEEEILLLSTDLRASRTTKVLEVMPFLAEPRVAKGDVAVFQQAVQLINSKTYRSPLAVTMGCAGDRSAAHAEPPGGSRFTSGLGLMTLRWRES
jgi:hypothetical protein